MDPKIASLAGSHEFGVRIAGESALPPRPAFGASLRELRTAYRDTLRKRAGGSIEGITLPMLEAAAKAGKEVVKASYTEGAPGPPVGPRQEARKKGTPGAGPVVGWRQRAEVGRSPKGTSGRPRGLRGENVARTSNNQVHGGKRPGAGRPMSERRKHMMAMARQVGCSDSLMGKAMDAFERIEPVLGGDRWIELTIRLGSSIEALYELSKRSRRCMCFVYLVMVGWYGDDDLRAGSVNQAIRWFELMVTLEQEQERLKRGTVCNNQVEAVGTPAAQGQDVTGHR